MPLPVLGPLFAQLARVAIPMLGRGAAAQAGAGAGARAAGQASAANAAGAAGQGGGFAAIFQRLRGANFATATAANAQRASGVQQAAQGTGQAAGNAANAAQSAGKVANSVAQGQQQTANNLANGLRNAGDVIRNSLKEGFRDISKKFDFSKVFTPPPSQNTDRQAEIDSLKKQISGHGSMMGQSLAPQDLQQRLAELEGFEAKDRAMREEATEQTKVALKTLTAAATGSVVALVSLPKAAYSLSDSLVAARENLKYFNVQIASAYARLEYTNRRVAFQEAAATSGSTTMLADSFAGLRRDLAPMKNAVTTGVNLLGIIAANTARAGANIAQLIPEVRTAIAIAKAIEWLMGKGQQPAANYQTFLKDVRDGKFLPQPPNQNQPRKNPP